MIGRTISHYRILERLGEGGMGVVYLADDLTLRRRVALKFLASRVAADPAARPRLMQEARAAASLLHPNICPVYEISEAEGQTFIAMAHLEGKTLRERLRTGPVPVAEALSIARQIAEGLAAAHAKGIVHRDVKPGNVMLLPEGRPVLMDFGLAHVAGGTKLTRVGATLGTTAYMSPEQAWGKAADARSDVWALGVVLYELLSGRLPFAGKTEVALLHEIVSTEPQPLMALAPNVPAGLNGIVTRALAKDPARRYQSAGEVAADLSTIERDLAAKPAGKGRRTWRQRVWRAAWAMLGAVVLAVALLALDVGGIRGRLGAPRIRSIAVLPLTDLTGDGRDEYFAEGITEELITNLAKIGALKVISHTSTMRYAGTRKALREIGRELGVDGVIEGSVLRVGERVRVTVQLLHAPTDRHVWAETYERDLSGILALQDEVARAIAAAVQATVTPKERANLAPAASVDPAVEEAYLRGLYHWNRRTAEDLRLALGYFQRATEQDSTFAPAWVGLSDTYGLLPEYDSVPREEAMPKALAAALKALAVDSTLAGAYAALGNVEKSWTLDWNAAERHYCKAIALNPGYATAHHWYAVLLVWRGRVRDGLAEIERARDLDPLSPMIQLTLARICYLVRDYPRAVREYQQTLELDPHRSSAWRGLSGVYFQQGRFREASTAWERGMALMPDSLGLRPSRLVAETATGYLRRRLATTLVLARFHLASPAELAAVYADLGARDAAFGCLRRAGPDELVLGDLRALPDYGSLRSDPRYQILEERLARRQSPSE